MPWTKLKNIILAILVLTNVCLLSLVAGPAIQSRRQLSQAREEAIRFLRSRGVQVEEDVIPQSMELTPQVLERDLEEEARAAAALLGGTVSVRARGGGVYRYDSENGSVQFHSDGTVSAQLKPGAFPLGTDRAEECLALMKRLGCEGIIPEELENELTFRQSWRGSPLFTQQVTLVCGAEGLTAITAGRQMIGQPQEDTSRSTLSVATVVIDFINGMSALGDVCNRIDSIEPGYITAASLSGPTVLTPVWRVTTDTGAYQIDTVTGGVSRVS